MFDTSHDNSKNIRCSIHFFFEQCAGTRPNNIALEYEGQTITYAALNQKANQLASFLRQKGIQKEDVVGIMHERNIEMVICLLAILKTGAAYLPIEQNLPIERIDYMLKNADAVALFTNSHVVNNLSFSRLQGFEKKKRKISLSDDRPPILDFDGLPIPDRSLIDLNKYKDKIGMASVTNCISIQTTRGCPFKCLYCHKIWSKKHVSRSALNLYSEIDYFYKNGIRNFAVIDDCFNLDIEKASSLLNLIRKNKLDIQLFFPNGLRGDILTPDFIDLMVEAGTSGINLSLETASPRLQKLLKKYLNLEKFHRITEYIATKHKNVILEMATMHGFPTETEEEAMMTLNFIKGIRWIHFPYIHILKIFPNTEMEKFALEHGISKEDILNSKDRAFHELPETLPFPKSFTRNYQMEFLNEYFLNKERLQQVLPVQMDIFDEEALVQKYNAYLPVEVKSIKDITEFADIPSIDVIMEKKQKSYGTIFDHKKEFTAVCDSNTKKILFLDLSMHFSSVDMLYKVAEQPIGLISLLTYAKKIFGKKIDGRIFKSGIDFDSFDELQSIVKEYQPDLIGIRTLTFFKEFFHKTVGLLKNWGVKSPVVCGGPYASSDYDTILKDDNVDLAILGEGEHTFADLLDSMFKNDFKLPEDTVLQHIKGIAYVKKNERSERNCNVILADCINNDSNSVNTELEDVSGENLAYVMYTSGSTGKPKGVMVEHRNVNNCIFWMQNYFRMTENDTVVHRTNISFDPSVWEIFWPLAIGAKVRILDEYQRMDVDYLANLIREDDSLSLMYCPSSLAKAMTKLLLRKYADRKIGLPWLVIGAEPCTSIMIRRLFTLFNGRIVNTYGPTECAINNTYYEIPRNNIPSVIPIGEPIANNKIYILDQQMNQVPKGTWGEIFISGGSVGRGYANNPELTGKMFISNPFGSGRLYRTGDIGKYSSDDKIEISGRIDDQIKIRGYRIEPGEIESAIIGYPYINDCFVTINQDKKIKVERKCKTCGISSVYPGVSLNSESICIVCDERKNWFPKIKKYFLILDKLEARIKTANRGTTSPYDCALLFAGGKASAYALYWLTERGFKVLSITYDNGYFGKKRLNDLKRITSKIGVDNIVLDHPQSNNILKASLEKAKTVCRGCFHASSMLAGEYALRHNINVVIGATLSRGQIIENKLKYLIKHDFSDISSIEEKIKDLVKRAPDIDEEIFKHIGINRNTVAEIYESIDFIDFYRYCDISNNELESFLSKQDAAFWTRKKSTAIYSTNCPIKQFGDHAHLKDKSWHYYGAATIWEKRLGHISSEFVERDLECNVTDNGYRNFLSKLGMKATDELENEIVDYLCAYYTADKELTSSDIRHHLKKKIPGYMIPAHFVQVDAIPLTINGKVDKNALPLPKKELKEYAGPRNTLDNKLISIWADVLNLEDGNISIKEDFFELGGDSLMAVNLMTAIEEKLGKNVSLSAIFQNASIEKLSDSLGQDDEDNHRTPAVLIKAGKKFPPYFFVHPVGGDVFCYKEFANAMGDKHDFYGIRASGIDGNGTPPDSINEMASYYIRSIKSIQPGGPYYLGGWSLGGVVAYEIVQQLQRKGETVGPLCLIDCVSPSALNVRSKDFNKKLSQDLGFDYDRQLSLISDKKRFVRTFRANMRAFYHYIPQPYANEIILFNASENKIALTESRTLGWEAVCQRIRVVTINGNHYSIIQKPSVIELAEQLKNMIDR